ncbi:MAG TPA: hypothetical protein VGM94_11715 [Galbitalea sp.]
MAAQENQEQDAIDPAEVAELRRRLEELHRTELIRWADAVVEAQRLFDEVERMRNTVSWRITEPLRRVRRRQIRA